MCPPSWFYSAFVSSRSSPYCCCSAFVSLFLCFFVSSHYFSSSSSSSSFSSFSSSYTCHTLRNCCVVLMHNLPERGAHKGLAPINIELQKQACQQRDTKFWDLDVLLKADPGPCNSSESPRPTPSCMKPYFCCVLGAATRIDYPNVNQRMELQSKTECPATRQNMTLLPTLQVTCTIWHFPHLTHK